MTFRATPAQKRSRRPGWEHDGRRTLYLNLAFVAIIVLSVLILVGAAGASYYQDHFGQVATVDGTTITKDDLRNRVLVDAFRLERKEKRIRDEVSSGKLTQDQANSQLQEVNAGRQALPRSSLDALVDATFAGQLGAKEGIAVTDAQIDAQLQVEATTPELRHLLIVAVTPLPSGDAFTPSEADKATAEASAGTALARIKAGADWAEVAKEVSSDPSAPKGGDAGWLSATGDLDQALLDAAFALPADGITGVVEGADGTFRFAKVAEIEAPATDPNYVQAIKDAGVPLDAYRAAVRGDLFRTALEEKITTAAVDTATPQRRVSEIFLRGDPTGGAPADEVKAAHILISPKHDPQGAANLEATDPAWEEAKVEADQIYADLEKDPARFAELAKTKSDDPGSGADGGILPWFKQAQVDASFGTAIFAPGLTEGQILAPVRSQFGWHIIRFDGRRADASIRIEAIKADLAKPGADFAATAKAESDASDAENGGDMGWIARNQIDPTLEGAIFAAPIGTPSTILKTADGWYIFLVREEQTRKPDGEQVATLKKAAFRNWYAAQKAAASIVEDPAAFGQ